jgi:ubiquinone/menaquinone biosynthesis C-methylase UbiE
MNQTELNKAYYNTYADQYDRIDGGRKPKKWIDTIIKNIALYTRGETFLDVCAGSGYISEVAVKYFKHVVAMDISEKMLARIKNKSITTIALDVADISIWENKFDCIACFAGIHHIENFGNVVPSVIKALKLGGVFWSDHDLDKKFYDKFALAIRLYRAIKDARLTPDVKLFRDLSETHNNGIDASKIVEIFSQHNAIAYAVYHWNDFIQTKRGYAPYARIIGIKT